MLAVLTWEWMWHNITLVLDSGYWYIRTLCSSVWCQCREALTSEHYEPASLPLCLSSPSLTLFLSPSINFPSLLASPPPSTLTSLLQLPTVPLAGVPVCWKATLTS